jgi:hypothetical protein
MEGLAPAGHACLDSASAPQASYCHRHRRRSAQIEQTTCPPVGQGAAATMCSGLTTLLAQALVHETVPRQAIAAAQLPQVTPSQALTKHGACSHTVNHLPPG